MSTPYGIQRRELWLAVYGASFVAVIEDETRSTGVAPVSDDVNDCLHRGAKAVADLAVEAAVRAGDIA